MKTHMIEANLTTEIVTIGPEEAQANLDARKIKRPVKPSKVQKYIRSIKNGTWNFNNGEVLQFDEMGRMLNGSHRMTAIVLGNIRAQFLVVRGVPEEAFHTMDQGSGRSKSDVLAIEGFPYYREIGAVVRNLHLFDPTRGTFTVKIDPDNSEVLEFAIARRERLVAAAELAVMGSGNRPAPKSILGTFYYLAEQCDPKRFPDFADRLITGLSSDPNEPAFKLRQKLSSLKFGSNGRHISDLFPYFVFAWNKFYDEEPLTAWRVPEQIQMNGAPKTNWV